MPMDEKIFLIGNNNFHSVSTVIFFQIRDSWAGTYMIEFGKLPRLRSRWTIEYLAGGNDIDEEADRREKRGKNNHQHKFPEEINRAIISWNR